MNPLPLKDKTAIITGAARGIGYGIAHRFAVEGGNVVISDIDEKSAAESASRIEAETGGAAVAMFCREFAFTMNLVCADARGGVFCAHQTAGLRDRMASGRTWADVAEVFHQVVAMHCRARSWPLRAYL